MNLQQKLFFFFFISYRDNKFSMTTIDSSQVSLPSARVSQRSTKHFSFVKQFILQQRVQVNVEGANTVSKLQKLCPFRTQRSGLWRQFATDQRHKFTCQNSPKLKLTQKICIALLLPQGEINWRGNSLKINWFYHKMFAVLNDGVIRPLHWSTVGGSNSPINTAANQHRSGKERRVIKHTNLSIALCMVYAPSTDILIELQLYPGNFHVLWMGALLLGCWSACLYSSGRDLSQLTMQIK